MPGIIRNPTEEERRDFTPLKERRKKVTAKGNFLKEMDSEQLKANKKKLPFAAKVAVDDFNDYYEKEAKKSQRKHGYIKVEDIQPVEMDWSKYSDLKNFDLIEEGERSDDFLTKTNPGLQVSAKKKKYRFKGYSNTYTLMEDGPESIRSARKKLKELEK